MQEHRRVRYRDMTDCLTAVQRGIVDIIVYFKYCNLVQQEYVIQQQIAFLPDKSEDVTEHLLCQRVGVIEGVLSEFRRREKAKPPRS